MGNKINIVIPSITTDFRLIRCLEGISKSSYKNFFVTLILENKDNIYNLKNFSFKINILIRKKKINMSEKRNIGVKKFKSTYVAFIDSDARPSKDWLKNSLTYFNKGFKIVGGPNIPFKNQNYLQKISYYCKRSFFITAHYNFLKYKSKNRICDWLDSSNFIMERNLYNSVNGMNNKLYIGEDHDFFYRLNEKFENLKIFYSKNLYVNHEDREIHLYLLQRFVYGLNVFAAKNSLIKRLFALLPFLIIIIIFLNFIYFPIKNLSIIFLFTFFFLFSAIFYEISKYVKNIFDKFLTVISILILNISYGFGTVIALFGLRKILEKKIYRKIQKKNS